MTINEVQAQIIEDFSMYDEWMDKYEYIIQLGKHLPIINERFKTNEYIINGCQSKVWIASDLVDGRIQFTADSDAIITKGIIALLLSVLNNRTPEEILETELKFINEIGLSQHLSPTRANGLSSMVKQIKMYALAYKTKQAN